MANSFKVVDMIAAEVMRIAHESGTFIAASDRQYDDSFKSYNGHKIGQTLRVKEPNRYVRTQGSRVMASQAQNESTQNITKATQDHVDMDLTSVDILQFAKGANDFDAFSKDYIEPAVKVLISGVESDFLAFATKATYNVAGTAGTAITSLDPIGAARAKLNQGLAPKDDMRSVHMDSIAMGKLVNGTAAYFNPTNAIGKQYREGMIARTGMADFYENERGWSMSNIADVTGTVDATSLVTDGGTTLDIHTTVASPNVGQVFTVAGVYSVHPETKAAYPSLQQFTVVATSAGAAITISPPTYLTGAKKNIGSITGADLTAASFNSATLTFVGIASTVYPMQLMHHKEAFQFVCGDLPLMDSADKCSRKNVEGLALRVWKSADIRNDEQLMRIDMLYGFAALRPEWACRIVGAAAA